MTPPPRSLPELAVQVRRHKWPGIAGLAVAVGLFVALRGGHNDRVRYLTAKIDRGAIRDAVEATGTVNPVVTVQVGSQVSGTIAKLSADFNSRVHKGEIIALIDSSLLRGVLLQAAADVENARANVSAAQANVDKAKATLVQAKANYDRMTTLARNAVATAQELELAQAAYDQANASVDGAAAAVQQAQAQVTQKAAAMQVARTNLGYTVIRSPIEGIVVARNVDVGQTVAASLQAPTIFTIAQDLSQMQVYAKVDESDVGRIKIGRPVSFRVDAFPRDTFAGTIRQVRMNPTTVQNVVTYDVVVDFANPELKLFPGMTAYVTIPVASVQDALKVPNAALRYRPALDPEDTRTLYRKYGVENGDTPLSPDRAVVWKRHADNSIEPVQVVLGVTDHAYTEVHLVRGTLEAGNDVIIGALASKSASPGGQVPRR